MIRPKKPRTPETEGDRSRAGVVCSPVRGAPPEPPPHPNSRAA
jgi:hypothetical protein